MHQDTYATAHPQGTDSLTSSRGMRIPLEPETASPQTHLRQASSTSSDFGSFVTVSTSDDPLGAGSESLNLITPAVSSAFDVFAGAANQRTKENEGRVLDELRKHDEDPLAWLNSDNEQNKSEDRGAEVSATNLFVKDSIVSRSPDSISSVLQGESSTQVMRPDDGGITEPSEEPEPTSFSLLHDQSRGDSSGPRLPASNTPVSVFPSTSTSSININEGPKERAQRNEKRVLDEFRAHEEDPLSWLKSKSDGESTLSTALQEASATLIDLDTPTTDALDSQSRLRLRPRSRTPPISHSLASTPPRPISLPHAISSPLIPRSPGRGRSQSPTSRVPKSPTISSPIGRSWMSSLGLFAAARPVPASSSSSSARGTHDIQAEVGGAGLSPTQSSLHALFTKVPSSPPSRRHARFATEGYSPIHSATMPLPTASTLAPDASPFASSVYIPPSGAPGFRGDRNWNTGYFDFDTQKKTDGKDVRLTGRNETTVPVLNSKIATILRSHLPPLDRLAQSWKLLYSADQHGLSLNTLYARCAPPVIVGGGGLVPGMSTGALVVIQDSEGGIFGAWIPEGVHLSHGTYYGGGDSFLWKTDKKDVNSEDDIQVYKWTGKNGYVAYCDTDGFSFGGGEGHYGLYVDASLVEGTTHPCPTFDNECLAHGDEKGRMVAFDAAGLEVWSVGS